MSSLELEYALPVTALQFTGLVTITTDTILGGNPTHAPTGAVATSVVASLQRYTLNLTGGFLQETSIAFARTDDGRLCSADVTRTGQAGKVVLGVVAAGAGIAGAFAGMPALGGILSYAVSAKALAGATEASQGEEPKPDPVAVRYAAEHEEEAKLLVAYREAVRTAAIQHQQAVAAALAATDGGARREAQSSVWFLQQMLQSARSELAPLEGHFSAWRAGTIKQRTEQYDSFVTLDTLRGAGVKVVDGEVSFEDSAGADEVRRAWDRLGLVATADPMGDAVTIDVPEGDDVIVVREPRVATLSVYERDANGKARLQRTVEQLVVDAASPWRTVTLDKSWFAKRSSSLRFSELGALTGISGERGSSAAAFADTLSALPGAAAGGLDQALTLRTKWSDLQSFGAEQQLAQTKKSVELAQARLTQAGLTATAADYGEVERLKQQAEMLAQRKAIGDSALDDGSRQIAALKQQVDALTVQTELSAATRGLAAERELSDLRLTIEKLQANQEWLKAQLPPK